MTRTSTLPAQQPSPTSAPSAADAAAVADLIVESSADQPAALCAVCGNDVAAGGGITARYQGRVLRFKCSGCMKRFSTNPERFLAGDPAGCCGAHKEQSPASEWVSD